MKQYWWVTREMGKDNTIMMSDERDGERQYNIDEWLERWGKTIQQYNIDEWLERWEKTIQYWWVTREMGKDNTILMSD